MHLSHLNAKRGTGLSDFLKEYVPQQLEEIKTITPVHAPQFHALIEKYKDVFALPYHSTLQTKLDLIDILQPSEINCFLQITRNFENLPSALNKWDVDYFSRKPTKSYSFLTGCFISKLIKNSYLAGYNDFTLDALDLPPLSELPAYLEGKKEASINISLSCENSKYVGKNCRDIMLTLYGNPGRGFANRSISCTFVLHGDLTYYVEDAKYCTFKTDREDVARQYLKLIPRLNKIVQMLPGEEKVVRDFDDI